MSQAGSDPIILVEGVSKKFCRNLKRSMAYGLWDVSKAMLGVGGGSEHLRTAEFWAVNDVSFQINRGEKIGFLGTNGSGKSTLLRLLNGIYLPDRGRITVRGKIGALISVGVGFHPHLTGRENIYLNATILGMKKDEIKKKFDAIVDFAEIGSFIDAPVSTYSSGMFVRLGFAIAIHADPDIMLVDEVLSVGDMAFGMKCQRKLSEYRMNGGTFVFVSHNMQAIRNACDRVLWLNEGQLVRSGDIQEVCDEYETFCLRKSQDHDAKVLTAEASRGVGDALHFEAGIRFEEVQFIKDSGQVTKEFHLGEKLKIRIHVRGGRKIAKPVFSIGIHSLDGTVLVEHYSTLQERPLEGLVGSDTIEFTLPKVFFRPGKYLCSIGLSEGELMNKLVWHERIHSFLVVGSAVNINQGLCQVEGEWRRTE